MHCARGPVKCSGFGPISSISCHLAVKFTALLLKRTMVTVQSFSSFYLYVGLRGP
ncbi:hypothetical protein L218DRAFT_958944 [Marasmius fiardii PR-910]|nr:hypothetical protein L218DRAFT_958944 [Marasmius fiardii PR-910]